MAKKPAKPVHIPRRPALHRRARGAASPASPPAKRKSRPTWPYVLLMLAGWGVIFGGIFFSHFLSNLPDVRNLMVSGPSQDITILDDRGRQIARRGLTQGRMVRVEDLPDYVP